MNRTSPKEPRKPPPEEQELADHLSSRPWLEIALPCLRARVKTQAFAIARTSFKSLDEVIDAQAVFRALEILAAPPAELAEWILRVAPNRPDASG